MRTGSISKPSGGGALVATVRTGRRGVRARPSPLTHALRNREDDRPVAEEDACGGAPGAAATSARTRPPPLSRRERDARLPERRAREQAKAVRDARGGEADQDLAPRGEGGAAARVERRAQPDEHERQPAQRQAREHGPRAFQERERHHGKNRADGE